MQPLPSLAGLRWAQIRALAEQLAKSEAGEALAQAAEADLAAQPAEAIRRLAALRSDTSDYARHSAGNALRDICRAHAALVDAETATWNLDDPLEAFTYKRVLKAQ